MSQYMENRTLSQMNYSTGYLEDVLFQFSSKRRRLMMLADDETNEPSYYSLDQNYWSSSLIGEYCDTFGASSELISKHETISDMKTPPEEAIISETLYDSSLSAKENLCFGAFSSTGTTTSNDKIKKIGANKVVYPFALVKPGGFEGDLTLNDINERILMPPTRPVFHPVGQFACRPLASPNGSGLSGNAAVAFTRIHTQGRRGTITIIRTRS